MKEDTMIIEKSKKASRGRTPNGQPNPIDVHVGNRIRLRRTLLGYSQEKMAALLGLTFQQVQKYERGTNRVGASRLWDIGNVLDVPVSFFYEDMDKDVANQSPRAFSLPAGELVSFAEDKEFFDNDPMNKKETIELVRAYYKIPNRKAAKHLYELIIAMSKTAYHYHNDNDDEIDEEFEMELDSQTEIIDEE